MTRWTYFYWTSGDTGSDTVPKRLGRTDEDGPRYNAQALNQRRATWMDSDDLYRYHVLGSTDMDYTVVPEDEARAIIAAWVSSGRLPQAPDEP
jgi:hypothetical protein